ncbi:hypothetical protein CTEN210_10092 [Chaetoceros tenuissimus]|uniref:peptidylprolyl isomerase n=1 Tax=Chaetoceros tenuissimus TaxID=426638 RepID=A0AAD3CYQ8_9STRA|nr:hypothetical protein CTEN210_10092 [Chaetoceros tenuissimus]
MGRRKRASSDDYDDSVERSFFGMDERKRNTDNLDDEHEQPSKSKEEIERQRAKKRAKKQRQKEKKEALKKEAEEKEKAKLAEEKKKEEQKQAKKKRKEVEKKEPPLGKFIKTHKGVKYCDIEIGTGPVIQDRKKVHVKYTLRAGDKRGKIIDSSGNFGFRCGKGEVISGWEIGLLRMKVGGTRHIIVPPKAGYGNNKDIGAGVGGLLYFEVTLLHVAP